MNARWHGLWTFAALAACTLTGCVERRFVITTDPPGAIVIDEMGMPIGAAPADHPFTYYGTYEFRVIKDGFQTQVVHEKIAPPWYECFPLDFISENLIPLPIRDVRRIHVPLQPQIVVPPDDVLRQGEVLRERGKTVGEP